MSKTTHLLTRPFARNEWDRKCMYLRAIYKLTPSELNRVLLSLSLFAMSFASETDAYEEG